MPYERYESLTAIFKNSSNIGRKNGKVNNWHKRWLESTFFDFRSKFNNYYAIRKLISKEKCNNQHPLYIYITNS